MSIRCAPAVALLACLPVGAQDAPEANRQQPLESALVEQAETRIAQIYISVTGPPDIVDRLRADDLRVFIRRKEIFDFTLDRVWQPGEAEDPLGLRRRGSYVFYYDQGHLSDRGWNHAQRVSRELIPRLIHDRDRGMLVSSARDLVVYQDWTDDAELLLQALDRLTGDGEQRINPEFRREQQRMLLADAREDAADARHASYDEMDRNLAPRMDALKKAINAKLGGGQSLKPKSSAPLDLLPASTRRAEVAPEARQAQAAWGARAPGRAMLFYMTEFSHTRGGLERLHRFLARLYTIDPPKSVVYFADTLVTEPGDAHLASTGYFDALRGPYATFDRLVNDAAVHGVRFYAVYSRPDEHRHSSDAWNAMSYLAHETAGQPLLRGQEGDRLAHEIRRDQTSLFLVSFDPAGFRQDTALPVWAEAKLEGVKVKSRGRFIVQSRRAELESSLTAALANAGSASEGSFPLQVNLIPVGFERGNFRLLAQVTTVSETAESIDLGASLLRKGKVKQEISRRISVPDVAIPVTLETELSLRPGPFEIVAAAHRVHDDESVARRFEGFWPDPDAEPALIGPIALVQPTRGAIAREDRVRVEGSLALGPADAVQADLPASFVTLVCRGKKPGGPVVVRRALVGIEDSPFKAVEFESGGDRCAVIRDVVRSDNLGAGWYRYRIVAECGGKSCAESERVFAVVASTPPTPMDASAGDRLP